MTNIPGTYVAGAMVAQNGGNPVIVTNGNDSPIVFAAAGTWATVSGGNGYTSTAITNAAAINNANFATCLGDKYYDSPETSATHLITLSGLVVGQPYSVQLFALDDGTYTPPNSQRTVNWQDPANSLDVSSTYTMDDNAYLVGTFTASNTVQMIQENLLTSYGNFNCLVLRAVGWTPPPYFILEPSGAAKLPGDSAILTGGSAVGDATIPNPTITYQWQAGPAGGPYTNLVAGAHYVGTTTTNLVINQLTAADGIPVYVLAASNGGGTTLSAPVVVTVLPPPPPGSYAACALSNNPVALWPLNETGNPATGTLPAADISGNGFNGVYGASAQNGYNGVRSPQPPVFAGFATNQGALQAVSGNSASVVTLPALNLNLNITNCTIALWICPTANPGENAGLLFNRTSGDASGLDFGGTENASGMPCLGYTWNDNSEQTWGYNSGLFPPTNAWSFVALVTSSSNAVLYLDYQDANGLYHLLSATNNVASTGEAWSGGTIEIGGDSSSSSRLFTGDISEAGIYTNALSAAQLTCMYETALGVVGFSPQITAQPQPVYTFAGASPQMSVTAGGTTAFAFQWQFNGTNLVNNAYFSGVTNSTLTISNVTAYDVGIYDVLITNLFGSVTSSNVTLTIAQQSLVGQWLNGTNSLTDVSGYSPAGTHDGYTIGGSGAMFTNDMPPNRPGQSLALTGGTAIAIANSSTWDASYTNTFDNQLQNTFTLTFWAKGFPSSWNYLISKNGDSGSPNTGWTLRRQGYYGNNNPCWTLRSPGGTLVLGADSYGSTDDMGTSTLNLNDGNWHFYAGTYTLEGNRNLYVDGVLVAQETGQGAYGLPSAERLVIGGIDDSPGNSFGSFFTGEFYDVRIYNYALTLPQLNVVEAPSAPTLSTHVLPGANGNPGQLVLTWNVGTLLETTNLTGLWTRTTNSSPFTNGMTTPLLFFRVSNP